MNFKVEFLWFSMAPKQAEFYFFILVMIAASITLVAAAYVYFWLADLRKKGKVIHDDINNCA